MAQNTKARIRDVIRHVESLAFRLSCDGVLDPVAAEDLAQEYLALIERIEEIAGEMSGASDVRPDRDGYYDANLGLAVATLRSRQGTDVSAAWAGTLAVAREHLLAELFSIDRSGNPR